MSSDFSLIPNETDLFSNLQADWEGENHYYEMVVPAGVYRGGAGFSLNPAVMILVLAVFVVIGLAIGAGSLEYGPSAREKEGETAVSQPQSPPQTGELSFPADSLTFVAPYNNYVITQGIHGMSYGHMAIDLAAGRGERILSPINGVITQIYTDQYGNPTLVIENDVYAVMFLHGDYSVGVGDKLQIGQQIGTESNHGYTMDMAGNLCYESEWCGNHTHLNVFDKRIQSNINPLDLIGG